FYRKGIGTDQNDDLAFEWCKKAANKGSESAQYALGNMYLNGVGVKQDISESQLWFKESCDNGFDFACSKVDKK
uniref:tetratricopeptide repeat protein n=5 Tax=Gammaproteobacteria TaxID=1236 RepID=UPI0015D390F5